MKAFVLLFIFSCIGVAGSCQVYYNHGVMRHQLTFLVDNNYFLFNGDDGYYTSGIFFKYDHIYSNPLPAAPKRIFSYEGGHMIYNAYTRKILPTGNQSKFPGGIEQIDRPIAGYLFGKVSCSSFYGNHRMFAFSISIGSTGKYSFGKDVQEFWHRTVGIKDHWNWVWDYQVNSELSVNTQGTFANSLVKKKNTFFQITPVTQATLGTAFTNVFQSVLFQLGRFRPMSSSSYWNSRLQLVKDLRNFHSTELYLFYQPSVGYQLYNATIQGGLFRRDKGVIVSEVVPFIISHKIGIRFSAPKYSFGYHVTFQTREAETQFHRQSFASLMAAFRF
jgi:lipid A 3-O-deacylase